MAAVVQLGQAEVDLTNRRVEGPAGRHHLTPLEASLLQFLIVRRGTTVSRDELLTEVWGYSRRVMTRAVDNTVSRLRRKVELDGDAPKWIVSTRGGGYRLEADPTQVAHQVPPERDAFVGRVDDLAALGRQLDGGARLVTILGPGGVGKTRVALRLAASRTAVHPGGVWFCDLSDARDAAGVVTAVARGLGVPVGPGDGVDAVRDLWVRRGRALVVLDNFEQVAAFAEPTLGAWLRGTTEAQVVVTSRARLGLDGEVVVALEPLPQADAEALFAVRAGALSGGAALPAEERPAVAALVALLDGLPLAIELAAARTGMLSPRGLLERMSDRFRVLTATGPRIDRHATLTATLDWSWHLLAEEERDALAQLSVFDGGFTPGAAEAVVELRGMWALDAVQALVDRSWVRRIAADRLDLLVSIRDYAAARLAERDGTRAAEERHGRHLAATVASEPARLALDGPTGAETFAALERERDNLAAAARRAIARGDGPVAAQTARAIWLVCARRGPVATAVALLEATLALPTLSERDRCLVSSPAGQARAAAGQPAIAIDHYRTGLALAEAQGLTSFAGQLHRSLGDLLHHLGDGPSARAHYAEALAAQRAVGNRRAEAFVLGNLGVTCIDAGDLVQAREHLAEALAVHREVGNRRAEGPVLGNLGLVAACEGRFDDARELLRESIATHRSFANLRGVATMTQNLAWVAVNQGQLAEADGLVSEAERILRDLGDAVLAAECRLVRAELHFVRGELRPAALAFESALVAHRTTGNHASAGVARAGLAAVALAKSDLRTASAEVTAALEIARDVGERRLEAVALGLLSRIRLAESAPAEASDAAAQADRVAREVGDRLLIGLVACTRAELHRRAGALDLAAAALVEAEAIAAACGCTASSELGARLAAVRG